MISAAIATALVQLVLFLQATKNRALFPRLSSTTGSQPPIDISVCLPMRNEEANAERLLEALSHECAAIREIIILDDESTDATPEILSRFQTMYPSKIHIIHGAPKPTEWRAKVWAMGQLATASESKYLLFLDADVSVAKGAIASVIEAALRTNSNFFSVFPKQVTTRGTDLLVNHLYTTLLHLLPMQFVTEAKYPSAVAGCGQVQLIEREWLARVGGYNALKTSLHDGLHMARLVKSAGGRVGFAYGAEIITCEMYPTFADAWNGFSRNAFQATGGIVSLLVSSSLLLFAFVLGPALSVSTLSGTLIVAIPTTLLYAGYSGIARAFDIRPDYVLRLPMSILISTAMQWWSYFKNRLHIKTQWRGRAA